MTQIRNMSNNARLAMKQGEKLYSQWSKKDIINEINEIFSETKITPPETIDQLQNVTERVLREYMLKKSSWHHVNNNPEWFYVVDYDLVCDLTKKDIARMMSMVKSREQGRNKPKMVIVKRSKWTEKGGHQFTKSNTQTAVVYNDVAYFPNGSRSSLHPGKCVIVKECGPIVKEKRSLFETILRHMRLTYNIAI